MNVKGKTTIFVKEIEGANGKFKAFSTTISHKVGDEFVNAYMNVRFAKELEEGLKSFKVGYCYSVNITEGWLDVRPYFDKEGKEQREIYIFVNSASVESKKKIESNELPNLTK